MNGCLQPRLTLHRWVVLTSMMAAAILVSGFARAAPPPAGSERTEQRESAHDAGASPPDLDAGDAGIGVPAATPATDATTTGNGAVADVDAGPSMHAAPFQVATKMRLVPDAVNTLIIDPATNEETINRVRRLDLRRRPSEFGAPRSDATTRTRRVGRQMPLRAWRETVNGTPAIRFYVPSFDVAASAFELERTADGNDHSFPWYQAYDLELAVNCSDDTSPCEETYDVELPRPSGALTMGILTILGIWLMAFLVLAFRIAPPSPTGKVRDRFRVVAGLEALLLLPFEVTTTELNRYSLSLFQVTIWTGVLAFGISFVWKITAQFLVITPQVLMLVGIGGGTALLSTVNYRSRLQAVGAYRKLIPAQKEPRFADLVTLDGRPSISRIQMLAFTVIIASMVTTSIMTQCQFPALSDGLVALMGISSGIYLGGAVVPGASEQRVKEAIVSYENELASADDDPQRQPDKKTRVERRKNDLQKAIEELLS